MKLTPRSLLAIAMALSSPFLTSLAVAQNNNQANVVDVEAIVTGQLKTRNYIVTIYASADGPLYTVVDSDGNVRGLRLSPILLAARFPALKSVIDNPADDASLGDFSPRLINNKIFE